MFFLFSVSEHFCRGQLLYGCSRNPLESCPYFRATGSHDKSTDWRVSFLCILALACDSASRGYSPVVRVSAEDTCTWACFSLPPQAPVCMTVQKRLRVRTAKQLGGIRAPAAAGSPAGASSSFPFQVWSLGAPAACSTPPLTGVRLPRPRPAGTAVVPMHGKSSDPSCGRAKVCVRLMLGK